MDEFSTMKDKWRHYLELLDHRRSELQDHYTDQGGDLKVFYDLFHASMDEETRQTDEIVLRSTNENDIQPQSPQKIASNFVSASIIEKAEPPTLSIETVRGARVMT